MIIIIIMIIMIIIIMIIMIIIIISVKRNLKLEQNVLVCERTLCYRV